MSEFSYAGAKAIVIGYGLTGRAVSSFLMSRGSQVLVFDDNPDLSRGGQDIEVRKVGDDFQRILSNADLVVVSPGVPRSHPVYLSEVEPISELELAYRSCNIPMVAVTGTNGKTTVTTLVSKMLSSAGYRVAAVGNIGTPAISVVEKELDFLVVEASSFQLATTKHFRPRVAAWTNFTPDHLDWHVGIDDYWSSKAKIFSNLEAGDSAVLNGNDPSVMAAMIPRVVKPVRFGDGDFEFSILDSQYLASYGVPYVALSDLPRRLPHDLENALASSAIVESLGVDLGIIADVLVNFKGLPHRVELVGTIEGVSYFNDSKATTPASVVAALSGFESAVLIAGGKNKGLDLSPLRTIAPNLRGVISIGDAADEVAAIFSGIPDLPVLTSSSMREAVFAARSLAKVGDAVILSPGCTSFDWYGSYGERGEDFRNIVLSMTSEGGSQ